MGRPSARKARCAGRRGRPVAGAARACAPAFPVRRRTRGPVRRWLRRPRRRRARGRPRRGSRARRGTARPAPPRRPRCAGRRPAPGLARRASPPRRGRSPTPPAVHQAVQRATCHPCQAPTAARSRASAPPNQPRQTKGRKTRPPATAGPDWRRQRSRAVPGGEQHPGGDPRAGQPGRYPPRAEIEVRTGRRGEGEWRPPRELRCARHAPVRAGCASGRPSAAWCRRSRRRRDRRRGREPAAPADTTECRRRGAPQPVAPGGPIAARRAARHAR